MKECPHKTRDKSRSKKGLILFTIADFLWLLFRNGTKASRVTYPCQQTALANVSILFSISIPLAVRSAMTKTEKFVSKNATALALLVVLAMAAVNVAQFYACSTPTSTTVNPNHEVSLALESRSAKVSPASDVYAVNGQDHMNVYAHQAPADNLEINGLVTNPLSLNYTQVEALPIITETALIQCVDDPQGQTFNWTGVPLFYLLSQAGVQKGAWKVVFHAQDGFSSSIPLEVAMHPTTILALKANGTALTEGAPSYPGYAAGYPYRIVLPGKYGYKWVGQIDEIELVDYDYKGTYESQGFSDTANNPASPQLPQTQPPYTNLNVTWVNTQTITILANSTIQQTGLNQTTKRIYIDLEPNSQTITMTYVTIPKRLLTNNFTVQADNTPIPYKLAQSTGNSYLLFNLDRGTQHVEIGGMLLTDITGPNGSPDGKVNMRDIAAEAKLFGVTSNDPRYDMNNDGKINMFDIAIVSRDFGKTTDLT